MIDAIMGVLTCILVLVVLASAGAFLFSEIEKDERRDERKER